MTAQRLTHSASIRHAYQPFPIPYCISLLDRGAALGTYLYIIMAALPEVVASLLTSGPVERLAAQPPRDMRLPPIASNTGNSLRAKTGKRP